MSFFDFYLDLNSLTQFEYSELESGLFVLKTIVFCTQKVTIYVSLLRGNDKIPNLNRFIVFHAFE